MDLLSTDMTTLWSDRVSDTWTRGQTPDMSRIRVRYATWRIVDHIVGQRLRIWLVHGSVVLISDSNRQCRKWEEERRWEAVETRWFQQKGGKGKDENREWVSESKGGGGGGGWVGV